MKKNKILMAALASAMFAGCADQDFLVVENGAEQGLNGKLVEAGLLTGSRGEEEAATRAYTALGKFVWMPTELESTGSLTAARKNQRVGFCWTGANNVNPEYAVAGNSKYVYTNYEYEHVGWMDVKAANPDDEICHEGELLNGAYIKGEGTPAAHFGGPGTGFFNAYYYGGLVAGEKPTGKYDVNGIHAENTGVLNLGAGIFRTNNASVFEGEYLVYYPYTDAFTKGEIVAQMPTSYEITVADDAGSVAGKYTQNPYAAASDAAFAIGYLNHYDGGNKATAFTSKTLNAFVGVKLINKSTTGAAAADVNIKSVMLYSETQGIMYSQNIDASKAVAALKGGNAVSADLFCGEPVKSNVVYANLTDGSHEYATIEGVSSSASPEAVIVALPVFPQTVNDLKIILVNDKDQTYTVNAATTTFTANGAALQEINLYGKTFENNYMVVDEASFWSAWEKINVAGSSNLAKTHNIKLLNDVRLTNNSGKGTHNSYFFINNVNINSACGAKLTFASETKHSIKGFRPAGDAGEAVVTFNVPVIIEGAACCENAPATLVIGTASNKDGKVVFAEDVTNHGTLVLNNNITVSQNVAFNKTLTNVYDEWAVKRGKTAGAAQVYVLGTVGSKLSIGTYNNINGQTVVASTAVNMDELFLNDNFELHAEAPVAARTTSVEIGTLKNEVLLDIHKYTMVTVNTAFTNTVNAVVKTAGEHSSTTDGRIDIDGNAANQGVIDNQGVANLLATLNNTGLFVDRQSGQVGGKMINNGVSETGATKEYEGMTYTTDIKNAGIYVAQVATVDRMKKILSDKVIEPSTNIVEVLGLDAVGTYNFANFEDNMGDKDLIINCTTAPIYACSFNTANNEAVLRDLAHCVTVLAGSSLVTTDSRLVVRNNVEVKSGAYFTVAGKNMADKSNIVIMGSVDNAGELNNWGTYFQIQKNLTNSGAFNSHTAFKIDGNVANSNSFFSEGNGNTVGGNITNTGSFDSDGDDNNFAGNFTQTAGSSTFATKTTTIIEGTFTCTGGTFERETIGGEEHRATVNVNVLGSVKGGSTSTAWPTEY